MNCEYLHSETKSSGWLRYCLQHSYTISVSHITYTVFFIWPKHLKNGNETVSTACLVLYFELHSMVRCPYYSDFVSSYFFLHTSPFSLKYCRYIHAYSTIVVSLNRNRFFCKIRILKEFVIF